MGRLVVPGQECRVVSTVQNIYEEIMQFIDEDNTPAPMSFSKPDFSRLQNCRTWLQCGAACQEWV
jgi:hypothetical protein